MSEEKKLPDNVALNPHSLPYASNLGAPVIKPNHSLGGWKIGAVHSANKHYTERYEELKKQFKDLYDEYKWNELIFNAEMRFKPVIGQSYHLYKKDNGDFFMSLFAPNECSWSDNFQGSFRLNYDNRWELISL